MPYVRFRRTARCRAQATLHRFVAAWSCLCRQYYSVSTKGASLARHMDEKHEEFKGARAWSSSSPQRFLPRIPFRARVDTAEGPGSGALRPVRDRVCSTCVPCGAHEGNLGRVARERSHDGAMEPVFLDAWVKAPSPYGGWTSSRRYTTYRRRAPRSSTARIHLRRHRRRRSSHPRGALRVDGS